jgi:hypothetical protein
VRPCAPPRTTADLSVAGVPRRSARPTGALDPRTARSPRQRRGSLASARDPACGGMPAGFGGIRHPRHRRFEPPTLWLEALKLRPRFSCARTAQVCRWRSGRVGAKSAPRADGAITPERAGPERAACGGVSLAWLHTNSEGPHRGTSLLGRTRRRVPPAAGCAARATAPSPRGTRKPHRVEGKAMPRTRLARQSPQGNKTHVGVWGSAPRGGRAGRLAALDEVPGVDSCR